MENEIVMKVKGLFFYGREGKWQGFCPKCWLSLTENNTKCPRCKINIEWNTPRIEFEDWH